MESQSTSCKRRRQEDEASEELEHSSPEAKRLSQKSELNHEIQREGNLVPLEESTSDEGEEEDDETSGAKINLEDATELCTSVLHSLDEKEIEVVKQYPRLIQLLPQVVSWDYSDFMSGFSLFFGLMDRLLPEEGKQIISTNKKKDAK